MVVGSRLIVRLISFLRKFAFFGLLDAVPTFIDAIAGPNTPATLQNIIAQSYIPWTMVATMIVLRVRYPLPKLGGAAVILSGSVIALIPIFLHRNDF